MTASTAEDKKMRTYSILAASAEGLEQPKQEATEQHIWPAHWAAQQAQLIPVHAMEAIENMVRGSAPRVAEKRGRGRVGTLSTAPTGPHIRLG